MEINYLQVIGYTASVIIAVSMTMSSILKFRWINLAGATTFALYGFLIGAWPVMLLNSFIVSVDIYYLISIYTRKEVFEILEVRPENRYLIRFLEFHDKDIQKFFPGFAYKPEMNTVSFFTLRNMAVAGVFLAHREAGNSLKVGLDYVRPEYRDFKNGRFIYGQIINKLNAQGITKVQASVKSRQYAEYLKQLGFIPKEGDIYEKTLSST